MAEPIVNHELDPGGGQHVELPGRHELPPRQQLGADHSWARQAYVAVAGEVDRSQRDASPKRCPRRAHEIVERTIDGAPTCGPCRVAPGPWQPQGRVA